MAGGLKLRPHTACIQIVSPCRIGMLTFGGKEFWDAEAGEYFLFGKVLEANSSFTIVNCGLNFYVYETAKIALLEEQDIE